MHAAAMPDGVLPTFSGRHLIRIGTRLGRVAQARAKAAAATTAEQRAEAVEQENRGRLRAGD
jgi:hypothetical protein